MIPHTYLVKVLCVYYTFMTYFFVFMIYIESLLKKRVCVTALINTYTHRFKHVRAHTHMSKYRTKQYTDVSPLQT